MKAVHDCSSMLSGEESFARFVTYWVIIYTQRKQGHRIQMANGIRTTV